MAGEKHRPYPFAGGLIYLDVDESPMMRRRAEGRYEPAKVAALQRLLRPGMTFVDVGANKGDFALIAARVMNDEGRVLAFEPSPENCRWIRKSIELNGYGSIRLYELALSDAKGEVPLFLGAKSGWHSLVPPAAPEAESLTVLADTLDSVLDESGDRHVDMMKLDVEGAELQVLHGAERALAESRPLTVLVDIHPDRGARPADVCELLLRLGFSIREPADPERELDRVDDTLTEVFAVKR